MRATLSKVLTKEAFEHMIPMAERWTGGVRTAIAEFAVPWHVTRLGCRAEYLFSLEAPKNGTQAHDAMDFELERFMHLYAMNRGILLTPFHNMALMSPQTEAEDIDKHTRVFREGLKELVADNLRASYNGSARDPRAYLPNSYFSRRCKRNISVPHPSFERISTGTWFGSSLNQTIIVVLPFKGPEAGSALTRTV